MAIASLKLWDDQSDLKIATAANASSPDTVLVLVSQTESGCIYKDPSRALSLPYTIEFRYKIGVPTALGNDKLLISIKNAISDGVNKTFVLTANLEVSVPRSTWVNSTAVQKVLCALLCTLANGGQRVIDFATGTSPTTDLVPHTLT